MIWAARKYKHGKKFLSLLRFRPEEEPVMVVFDTKKIRELARRDFERAWLETSRLVPEKGRIPVRNRRGEEHPVRRAVQEVREILLDEGFDEIENRTIIPAVEVYKQYGPEAPVILDRVFFLAELPRPDIGLGKEKIEKAREIIGDFDPEVLKGILREYKKGEIEGDDLVEELVTRLGITTDRATLLLERVFPEIKKLKPYPTELTLRSHMTGAWYETLAALQDKEEHPIMLFSVGPRYRNEQREDATHLRVHHSASIVVLDENMSLEAGREITKRILKRLGFERVKIEKKRATSKYYADGSEEEVFVEHNGEWVEIADIGMYSPVSLANYGIRYPVFNMGIGIERLVMVREGYKDVRQLAYPQFYPREYTDEELAREVWIDKTPQTRAGKRIAEHLERELERHALDRAPVEVVLWEGEIEGARARITAIEREEGKTLLGPAWNNRVYTSNGNIVAYNKEMGVDTGVTYLRAISSLAARTLEEMVEKREKKRELRIGIVRSPGDVNIRISRSARRFITDNRKKIDVRGPVFLTLVIETG